MVCAVRYTHSKLMSGECVVQDCNYEYILLQDASQYCIPALDELKKGWGRRSRITEGGTYGKKYITNYKEELKELFDKGNLNKIGGTKGKLGRYSWGGCPKWSAWCSGKIV